MATKGTVQFSTHHLFNLLWRNAESKGDLVQLFQSLSRVEGMKDLAHTMQLYMFQASKSTRNVMNTVWLQAFETPAEVFTTLRLADNTFENFNRPNLIGWLRYSKDYSKSVGFSTKDTLDLLMKAPHKRDTDFGLLFLSLKKESSIQKDAGVMKLVEKLQAQLFKNWMDSKMTPDLIAGRVVSSATTNWERVFSLPITDPKFKLVEEYTLKYAANEGGDLLARVRNCLSRTSP
ncbi:hypothetical protein GN958_ATG01553 [Phytophthora infestans]|uniref:RXLR effector family protein n=1 Tax=Phytophthora infestans TaxID=4787 RepID=A0A8S9VD36_PHYIN|nr:hypothetical protein GN958_ATG01553 [Phytophthora infestans]